MYKRKSVGAHPVHLQIGVLLLRRVYTWYMARVRARARVCLCVCVFTGQIIAECTESPEKHQAPVCYALHSTPMEKHPDESTAPPGPPLPVQETPVKPGYG